MKKFLFVSVILAAIGLAVGLTGRDTHGAAGKAREIALAEATTTTTVAAPVALEVPPAAPVPTVTTVRPATPASVAAPTTTPTAPRVTTTTTVRPATTTTTVAPATTTPAPVVTTVTTAAPAHTCAIAVASPTIAKGAEQVATVTSDLPNSAIKLSVISWTQSPSSQSLQATSDASGTAQVTWGARSSTKTVRVTASFVGTNTSCSTTYEVA